jgi:Fe-S cluster assembly protein SufD
VAPSPADAAATAALGFGARSLDALLERYGEGSIAASSRYDALARYEELPARGPTRGRYWKHDLAALDGAGQTVLASDESAAPELHVPVGPLAGNIAYAQIDGHSLCDARGGIVEPFDLARARRPDAFARAFGRALDARDDSFASLSLAFQRGGAFVDVPAGRFVEEPLVLAYEAHRAAMFPYTLVHVGAGASLTVVERIRTGGPGTAYLFPLCELVLEEGAALTYIVLQEAGPRARVVATRRAVAGADAKLSFAVADLGAELSVDRIRLTAEGRGANVHLTGIFFADAQQHVDLETETRHAVGPTTSQTVVRTGATAQGQGRYLGNIRIAEHANGSDASLRDDALLMSPQAHVDSIPALEIASNDVKAFHGATIGSIDEDELFYAQSRGIERGAAERMIALGFFEPAIAQFAGEELREHLRRDIQRKLG